MYSFARTSLIKQDIFPLFALPAFIGAVLLYMLMVGAIPTFAEHPSMPVLVPLVESAPVSVVYHGLPLASTAVRVSVPAPMSLQAPVPLVRQTPAVALPIMTPKLTEAHLLIPKISVNAVIKDLGLTAAGAMAVPGNRVDVSWFDLGTRPGDTGSAVIGGHNYWNGAGVFVHLDQLAVGDTVSVISAQGVATSFVVRDIRSYSSTADATDIFQSASGTHLNLITCSGDWDPALQTYSQRLVVFTDAV